MSGLDELMIVEWLGLDPVYPQPFPAGGFGFTTELCLKVLFELAERPETLPAIVASSSESAEAIRDRIAAFQEELWTSGCPEYPADASPAAELCVVKTASLTGVMPTTAPNLYGVINLLNAVGDYDRRRQRWIFPRALRLPDLVEYKLKFGEAPEGHPHYFDHMALEMLVVRLTGARLLPKAEVWFR